MKKPTFKKYQKFIKEKKDLLEESSLLKSMVEPIRSDILYGRLMIEIYNKFLKNKDEEQR